MHSRIMATTTTTKHMRTTVAVGAGLIMASLPLASGKLGAAGPPVPCPGTVVLAALQGHGTFWSTGPTSFADHIAYVYH